MLILYLIQKLNVTVKTHRMPKLDPDHMNPSKPKRQTSCDEQCFVLRHEMANILSTLNLRLYAIKQQQLLNANETEVFDQCLMRLRALLEQWKHLSSHERDGVTD